MEKKVTSPIINWDGMAGGKSLGSSTKTTQLLGKSSSYWNFREEKQWTIPMAGRRQEMK